MSSETGLSANQLLTEVIRPAWVEAWNLCGTDAVLEKLFPSAGIFLNCMRRGQPVRQGSVQVEDAARWARENFAQGQRDCIPDAVAAAILVVCKVEEHFEDQVIISFATCKLRVYLTVLAATTLDFLKKSSGHHRAIDPSGQAEPEDVAQCISYLLENALDLKAQRSIVSREGVRSMSQAPLMRSLVAEWTGFPSSAMSLATRAEAKPIADCRYLLDVLQDHLARPERLMHLYDIDVILERRGAYCVSQLVFAKASRAICLIRNATADEGRWRYGCIQLIGLARALMLIPDDEKEKAGRVVLDEWVESILEVVAVEKACASDWVRGYREATFFDDETVNKECQQCQTYLELTEACRAGRGAANVV